MQIEQKKYSRKNGWESLKLKVFNTDSCNLVLVFGSTTLLEDVALYSQIRQNYPNADLVINSTSGEIYDTQVNDETISLTAICFEKTRLKTAIVHINETPNSHEAGKQLADALNSGDLKNVLVISAGLNVNGSDLVQGLSENLPETVIITGGLAGDGHKFIKTLVGLNEIPIEGRIVAIGFYGDHLNIGYGSVGGWDSYGPERLITKSDKNILYELDGKVALDIYKMYLGEYAGELPASGLFFPLSFRSVESGELIVRTILGINEAEKSLTFAGNMPEGAFARLMMANFDRLIEGSALAAQHCISKNTCTPQLALLVSCIGRKQLLNQRIEEEIEVIRDVFGPEPAITGFYSYGEISPSFNHPGCVLHNETMTITTFSENE